MIVVLPRRAAAVFYAAPLWCALVLVSAPCFALDAPSPPPAAPVPVPVPTPSVVPAAPFVTPSVAPGSTRALLSRAAPTVMGQNNGVRLWVHGDGSNAVLRVQLQQADANAPDGQAPSPPTWVSAPFPLNFVGWHEVVLPKSKFTRRPDQGVGVDRTLPPDAQDGVTVAAAQADWSGINSLALDVRVPKRSSVVVDDVSWVTLDAQNTVTAETSVDDFEKGNVAAWVPGGTSAQQALMTYGLATLPALVHGGRVAFKMDIVSPSFVRQTTQVGVVKSSLAASGKAYLTFVPASRFAAILPSTLPGPTETSASLAIQACPEQIQAASFCVYSQKSLQDVTVTLPTDLQAVGHALSRTNIDVRVVKVWNQAGTGPMQDPDTASPTPELLVKDDRVALSGPNPAARLAGAPITDIPADTTKQFWVTVSVPRGTLPGHYTGSLVVAGKGMMAPPTLIRLDVNVLPLRLLSAAKQYGLDLRSRLDPAPAALPTPDGRAFVTDFVSPAVLDAQLADIVAHGFRITTLYDSPATVWDAVTEYQKYGISDPYIYKGGGDPAALESARAEHKAPSFLYYMNPDPTAQTGPRMAALTKGGLTATTYISRQADYDALQANLEVPIYNRDSAYTQKLLQSHGQRLSSKRDWWYWSASDEDPDTNRLDCGFLLWRANLYGAFLPAYQEAFGADPFDDTSAGAVPSLAAFRPQMLTYPVQDGVLDTLQWEACREGVTDVRYLTTLYTALRECKDAHIQKPLTDQTEAYVKALLDKPLAQLPDSELDKARAQIATYAVTLRAAVDAFNKKAVPTP